MKTNLNKIRILFLLLSITACQRYDFDKEMTEKVICIISDNDFVYTGMHDLTQEESAGHISINCGGSLHIDQDVEVTLESDPDLLDRYNKLKYDIDESKYAKILPEKYYTIPRMGATLEAKSPDTYGVVPILVRPEGLSPDSIYLIPLRIKEVSNYTVNPDKYQVLYQVHTKNIYARTDEATRYNASGKLQREDENARDAAVTQTFHPLTGNSFRIFAGIKGFEPDEDVIQQYGIIVTVKEDNTLEMKPYGTVELALADPEISSNYGTYELAEVFGGKKRQCFSFKYKYRLTGEDKWETVTLRSLRDVTFDKIDE
ncbi:MAG: DUF4361 domain-containing protein [Bacteroides sp.]|nr:DUF4361 domain-containing protein [Bacteroides sp.]